MVAERAGEVVAALRRLGGDATGHRHLGPDRTLHGSCRALDGLGIARVVGWVGRAAPCVERRDRLELDRVDDVPDLLAGGGHDDLLGTRGQVGVGRRRHPGLGIDDHVAHPREQVCQWIWLAGIEHVYEAIAHD
ncbi:hypothetical protein [Mumia sp. DW29H23]|uniref:hypothetical protein n=1 Tax=Mumia sp. DW29H23 TaxID=3421241 RepID=UPI003D69B1CE